MPLQSGVDCGATRGAFGMSSAECQQEIDRLLLTGVAQSMSEAENLFLDTHLLQLASLIASLDEQQATRHDAVQLLLRHGSRPWEDALR